MLKEDKILRVGIIGTGWIAEKAAITLNGLNKCTCYAIGSRTLEKAEHSQGLRLVWGANSRQGRRSGVCSYTSLSPLRRDEGGATDRQALSGREGIYG